MGPGFSLESQGKGLGKIPTVELPTGGSDIGFFLPIPGFFLEPALEIFLEYRVEGVGSLGRFIG